MTIYGKEIDFKISNVKHATNAELALEELGKTENVVKSMDKKDLVTVLTSMISMFQQFFITATGEDVLVDCEDLQEARDAYEQFFAEIEKQKKSMLAPYSINRIK